MRKQIAAANWKMNNTLQEGEQLLNEILSNKFVLGDSREVVFAIPFPFLIPSNKLVSGYPHFHVAAQNCSEKTSGAYTGETSVGMLASIGVKYCVIGHSERREYFGETNEVLAQKTDLCLASGIVPIFCCGEPLNIREQQKENEFVEVQLKESLFHLNEQEIRKVVIAYEPIWAIGTGKTASSAQAQEMHAFIRSVLANQYGSSVADEISILYGGSVKASNAVELFSQKDVDGGLVGGASLVSSEFIKIINALK